jgi:hypothetical protein
MTRWWSCGLVVLCAVVGTVAVAGQTAKTQLVARYALDRDLTDATRYHAPLQAAHALLQPGKGLFCSGLYVLDDPDGCDVHTPPMDEWDVSSFTISAQFLVPKRWPFPNPVFVAGRSRRWLGYELQPDGGIQLLFNNSQRVDCRLTYRIGVWHEATLTYDGSSLALYLDGMPGCRLEAKLNSGSESGSGSEKQLMLTNFSNAETFYGGVRELTLSNGVLIPPRRTPEPDPTPNPAAPTLAPVDQFMLTCPTAGQMAAIDKDLRLAFQDDPTKDEPLACAAAAGSRDLSPFQRRVYNTLRVMQQLQFDQPLPWTKEPLYGWFTHLVGGIRFDKTAPETCCVAPRTISISTGAFNATYTDLWIDRAQKGAGTAALLLRFVHQARHADGGLHNCARGRDRTPADLGPWGVEYSLTRWLAEHTDQAFFSAGSTHYADVLTKQGNRMLHDDFCSP